MPIVAYELTGSYAASGFAQAGMVAQLALGPFGGVIADRYKKKPLVLGSQILPCAIIVATGMLTVTDNITIPLLFGSTFLMGGTFSLMGPGGSHGWSSWSRIGCCRTLWRCRTCRSTSLRWLAQR